jgi:hypothetical protein
VPTAVDAAAADHLFGLARVDLSARATRRTGHAELVRRVVETRAMSPAGTSLEEAERLTVAGGLSR